MPVFESIYDVVLLLGAISAIATFIVVLHAIWHDPY